jgi:hypothetical protein
MKGEQEVQDEERTQEDNCFKKQFVASVNVHFVLFKVTIYALLEIDIKCRVVSAEF